MHINHIVVISNEPHNQPGKDRVNSDTRDSFMKYNTTIYIKNE